MGSELIIVIAARNEADRIAATIGSLRAEFPDASIYVADDASDDGTAGLALEAGATVISRGRPHGKGGNMTAAVTAALGQPPGPGSNRTFLLCDGDLGETAGRLGPLVDAVGGGAGMAVAIFAHKVGGGVGLAKDFAGRAIERRSGFSAVEPISGQRALSEAALMDSLPFAPRYGMEIGMTVDVVRAGHEVVEVEVDLAHRATGRTLKGFIHRARQLNDFVRVYRAKRLRD